ncbi:hypothetical protein AGMMS50225_04440 [Betaproteobacteria bacterium]|nr:hypothetical protein AGMMS50225_04440 [Betaproteobacteria bacterium]
MFDTLKASLLEKYGDPSRDPSQEPAKERSESDLSPVIVTTGSRSFEKDLRWNYDREGKFLHGSEALSLCGWDHTNMPPGSFKPTCGYKIEVDVSIHNRTIDNRIGEGPVTSYRIAITYVKPIFDELVIKDEEEKLAKQRRVQQNRPQL